MKSTIVDRWYWDYEGPDQIGSLRDPEDEGGDEDGPSEARSSPPPLIKGQKVLIEVRLVKESDASSVAPRATKSVEFLVGSKELDIWVQGTDIECLRAALWSKLDKRFEITWEEYLLIQISDARGFCASRETGLSLGESRVWRGTTPDGKLLLREIASHYRANKTWCYRVWPGDYETKNGGVIACIPASDANREAVKEFHARIEALRDRLAELVRPKNIKRTLEDLASTTALPNPVRSDKDAELAG